MRLKIILGLKILIIFAIIALTALIYFQPGDFSSIDLGRHLKNGQLAFSQSDVLFKNLYSYTEPDFPFVNHHWLSGVIFWLLYSIGGFKMLSVLNMLLAVITVLIAFKLAVKKSNFWLASVLALPVIILLSERIDIRPEMFSNLFIVLVFYILSDYRSSKSAKKLVWLLPIFFLWVNTHIYFFIGLFMVGLALLEQVVIHHKNFLKIDYAKKLFYFFLGSAAVCLLNPNFLKGLLYPFTLLTRYGQFSENYEIVENKSPFYLENLIINQNILIFKILLLLLAVSFLLYFANKYKGAAERALKARIFSGLDYFYLFSAGFFSAFAMLYIRNLPAFGLIALPIMANNLKAFAPAGGLTKKYKFIALSLALFLYVVIFSLLIYDNAGSKNFIKKSLGLGVRHNSLASINFYKDNNLTGPIFNNFDIGSALDFWLYPGERVFVDNRPDVYSREFFKEIYIPMQNDEAQWKSYSEKYKINLIYFSHTDGTPWAREFLAARLNDEQWPLIYFDHYALIMVKNNKLNQGLIEKYNVSSDKFAARLSELRNSANDNEKISLAGLASLNRRDDLAEKIYLELLGRRPNDEKILASLGYLYAGGRSAGEILKSISFLEKAAAGGYALPAIYNQLGLGYWSIADYDQAKKMWRQALKIDNNNEHAKYYLNQANGLVK
ncbi:MAG: hypothetical protein Q8O93_00045 [bacterium]|nr:hypothetical protein [bacterium]